MPADTFQTITISGVPKELLKELEILAKQEARNRSNYIVKTLAEVVRDARTAKKPSRKAA